MATITVRGYANKPETRSVNGTKVGKFSLSEKVKDPKAEKGFYRIYYNVDHWESDPPEDGTYVEVTGYLKVRKYKGNDGTEKQSLDIKAKDVCVPERDTPARQPGDDTEEDPFKL